MKKTYIVLIAFFLCNTAYAQSIIVTGTSWSVSPLSSATVITKAGKNYENFETSDPSQTLLKVSALLLCTINVQQIVGANWDPALQIYIRRTGNGTGLAAINGGTNYQLVTSTSRQLFTALLSLTTNRDNIPIQYQIQGLSVLLPAKAYSTTIMYTISGL